MKKVIFINLFLFIIHFSFGQSQRTILLENFVQASCQYSRIYNQEIKNYLDTTILPVIMINYHMPIPGEDIMYEQNPEDVDTRMEYYNVYQTPVSIIDGNYFHGGPIGSYFHGIYGWTSTTMNNRSLMESPFEISVNHEFSDNLTEINIQISVKVTEGIDGDFDMNIVVLEKQIEFEYPPGTNGEYIFFNVMKDFPFEANTVELENSYNAGDSMSYSSSWTIENIYEKEMISVVAFIQENTTKEVMQSGISHAKAIYENDVEILSVTEPTKEYCNDPVYHSVSPVVRIRNRGSKIIDSLIVYSQINNEPIDTSNFSLSLGFFKTKELIFDNIEYSGSPPDTIKFEMDLPNVDSEADILNNSQSVIFDTIPDIITPILYFYLQPDNYGSETTWNLTNDNGDVLYSGGPYEDQNTTLIQDTFNLTPKGCYYFTIYDSYGDGINTDYGEGYYLIISNLNDTIACGGNFKSLSEYHFKTYKNPPIPAFDPMNGEVNVSVEDKVYIRFNEKIRFLDNTILGDPDTMFILRKNNEYGDDVIVNFIDSLDRTIYFNDDLEYWTTYYLAFKEGLEDYYDNPIPPQSIIFRTRAEVLDVRSGNNEKSILISPNPAKEYLNIEIISQDFKPGEIIIINQYGQIIDRMAINKTQRRHCLDLKMLSSGIYFLQIKSNRQVINHKIIKI